MKCSSECRYTLSGEETGLIDPESGLSRTGNAQASQGKRRTPQGSQDCDDPRSIGKNQARPGASHQRWTHHHLPGLHDSLPDHLNQGGSRGMNFSPPRLPRDFRRDVVRRTDIEFPFDVRPHPLPLTPRRRCDRGDLGDQPIYEYREIHRPGGRAPCAQRL